MARMLGPNPIRLEADFGVLRPLDHKILWMTLAAPVGREAAWTARAPWPRSVGMNLGTTLFTALHGRLVGTDASGNRYFEARRGRADQRRRRWVAYAGADEPSAVPAEWHAWLHHLTDAPLPATAKRPWQKPHQANLTGTPAGYRPPGHDYQGGQRSPATGDYEAWTPGS